jgi:hypothetical protein
LKRACGETKTIKEEIWRSYKVCMIIIHNVNEVRFTPPVITTSRPLIFSLTLLVGDVRAPSIVVSEDARYFTGWLNVRSWTSPDAIFF